MALDANREESKILAKAASIPKGQTDLERIIWWTLSLTAPGNGYASLSFNWRDKLWTWPDEFPGPMPAYTEVHGSKKTAKDGQIDRKGSGCRSTTVRSIPKLKNETKGEFGLRSDPLRYELPISSPGSTRPTFLALKKTEESSLTIRIRDLHGFFTDLPKNYLVGRPMMIPLPRMPILIEN